MEIETYEITEANETGKVDDYEQVKELTEKLQLEGQSVFFQGEKKVLFPYRKITKQESLVYSTVLSDKTRVEKFQESVIPLRVLQVIAHARELNYYDYLEVWHCPNADLKDPLLVGVKGTEYSGERHILARWGEVLESFETLSKMALIHLKKEARASYDKELAELLCKKDAVEFTVEGRFLQGERMYISVACH